ncbi:MAG TPA: NYN domain-containing protein [Bryobacteraceae bacterium]|nr:NYN domain-containing protein [Bryobacteraceae bacterium]
MLFVDGENLTFRAQENALKHNVSMPEGQRYRKDTFIWPFVNPPTVELPSRKYLAAMGQRAYYYTSIKGDDVAIASVKQDLWNLGFTPQVFKKVRQEEKAKGVDISLTKDMLSHAFFGHYEVACLVAGDGDYVPLVEEVKRQGKLVVCMFFADSGLNPALRLACDEFIDLNPYLANGFWTR